MLCIERRSLILVEFFCNYHVLVYKRANGWTLIDMEY